MSRSRPWIKHLWVLVSFPAAFPAPHRDVHTCDRLAKERKQWTHLGITGWWLRPWSFYFTMKRLSSRCGLKHREFFPIKNRERAPHLGPRQKQTLDVFSFVLLSDRYVEAQRVQGERR